MASVSLVSINVEGGMHLERVLPFLAEQRADIVCVQEILDVDITKFEEVAGTHLLNLPMMRLATSHRPSAGRDGVVMGISIFSRHPSVHQGFDFYHKASDAIPDFDPTDTETKRRTQNLGIIAADIEKDGVPFRLITTHFTWTPFGDADDYQRADAKRLLEMLSSQGEFALCGDFNAPRGREIYRQFAAAYQDTIPPQYETSIDASLHREGKNRPDDFRDKMVDYLFTTPAYAAKDVSLRFGVSDHAAILATIEKES
jgi:endonuclease/exonuclease/phosphatase family metal-dependent hydrolase